MKVSSSSNSSYTPLEILKTSADISDAGYGRWAYEQWEQHNIRYFDNQLIPGGIFWGLTPHGFSLGYYERWRNAITLHSSLVQPASNNPWSLGSFLGEKLAKDVLLHEMIHQAINQIDNYDGKQSHNCQPWCDRLNQIIPLLDIEIDLIAKPIKQKRIKQPGQTKGNGKVTWVVEPGCMTRKQLAGFPMCFRNPDQYRN